jgi:hypothetical protein
MLRYTDYSVVIHKCFACIGLWLFKSSDYSVVIRKAKSDKEMWPSAFVSPKGSVCALLVSAFADDYDVAGSPNDRQAVPGREYVSMGN